MGTRTRATTTLTLLALTLAFAVCAVSAGKSDKNGDHFSQPWDESTASSDDKHVDQRPLVKWVHNLPRFTFTRGVPPKGDHNPMDYIHIKPTSAPRNFNASSKAYAKQIAISGVPTAICAVLCVVFAILFPICFCIGNCCSRICGCHSKRYKRTYCLMFAGLIMVVILAFAVVCASLEVGGAHLVENGLVEMEELLMSVAKRVRDDLRILSASIDSFEETFENYGVHIKLPKGIKSVSKTGDQLYHTAQEFKEIYIKYVHLYEFWMTMVFVVIAGLATVYLVGFCTRHGCVLSILGFLCFLVVGATLIVASVHIPISLGTADACYAIANEMAAAETLLDNVLECNGGLQKLERNIEKAFKTARVVIDDFENMYDNYPSQYEFEQTAKRMEKVYKTLQSDVVAFEDLFNCTYIEDTLEKLEGDLCGGFLTGLVMIWVSLCIVSACLFVAGCITCHGYSACKGSKEETTFTEAPINIVYAVPRAGTLRGFSVVTPETQPLLGNVGINGDEDDGTLDELPPYDPTPGGVNESEAFRRASINGGGGGGVRSSFSRTLSKDGVEEGVVDGTNPTTPKATEASTTPTPPPVLTDSPPPTFEDTVGTPVGTAVVSSVTAAATDGQGVVVVESTVTSGLLVETNEGVGGVEVVAVAETVEAPPMAPAPPPATSESGSESESESGSGEGEEEDERTPLVG